VAHCRSQGMVLLNNTTIFLQELLEASICFVCCDDSKICFWGKYFLIVNTFLSELLLVKEINIG